MEMKELFGSLVFNDAAMRQRLPKDVYKSLHKTIEDGKAASKPADPAADGWEFGGWFTDGECRQAYDFATPVTSDLTLYAKWTQKAAAGKATSPKTGDAPSLLPVMALLLLSAAALCLALFALSRRKPAHAGKHARR